MDRSGLNDRSAQHGWRCRELSGEETMIELLPRRVMPWLEQLGVRVIRSLVEDCDLSIFDQYHIVTIKQSSSFLKLV